MAESSREMQERASNAKEYVAGKRYYAVIQSLRGLDRVEDGMKLYDETGECHETYKTLPTKKDLCKCTSYRGNKKPDAVGFVVWKLKPSGETGKVVRRFQTIACKKGK